MAGVNDMADTDCPKQSGTPIRASSDALMVFNHADRSFRNLHFLNAWVPNQKAMIELRINISSSLNTFSIATANGMPVV